MLWAIIFSENKHWLQDSMEGEFHLLPGQLRHDGGDWQRAGRGRRPRPHLLRLHCRFYIYPRPQPGWRLPTTRPHCSPGTNDNTHDLCTAVLSLALETWLKGRLPRTFTPRSAAAPSGWRQRLFHWLWSLPSSPSYWACTPTPPPPSPPPPQASTWSTPSCRASSSKFSRLVDNYWCTYKNYTVILTTWKPCS